MPYATSYFRQLLGWPAPTYIIERDVCRLGQLLWTSNGLLIAWRCSLFSWSVGALTGLTVVLALTLQTSLVAALRPYPTQRMC